MVNVHVAVSRAVAQAPDQIAVRSLSPSVIDVPAENAAEPVLPTGTLSPAGCDDTVTPERPVAVTVSFALPATGVAPFVIVSVAVCVPPSEAVMVEAVGVLTAVVAIPNVAVLCPWGTTTLCGTVADALLLERKTAAPPAGAAMLSVMVPVDDVPPATVAGLSAREETDSVGAVPQTPGVPPPPHVSPKPQPQDKVPPHPSDAEQIEGGRSRQVFGAHPARTVSGMLNGACPGAPELAEMSTVACVATELEACTVSAPPPVVHPPNTNGCPAAMIEAMDGSLLLAEICTPDAGAIFCRTTSMIETPPGATVEGESVNEASGGGGGGVPPGFNVSVAAWETSSRETPVASR